MDRRGAMANKTSRKSKPTLLAGGNPQVAKADGCFTKYVKVAFFRGTSLRPLPPGESRHKDVRYLDIHEDDQLDAEFVASWITQASKLPGWVP